jgi:hypothetical protein
MSWFDHAQDDLGLVHGESVGVGSVLLALFLA